MNTNVIETQFLAPFSFSACCCALILWALLYSGRAWSLGTDIPGTRSLHTRPTPRVGGWGVSPASFLSVLLFAPQLCWVAILAFALAALCQIDDRRGLSVRVRFLAQIVAAGGVCLVYVPYPAWWAWPVLIVALVWCVNLYNFMDGADGLAGGMALIGFMTYALAAMSWSPALALASVAIAGAAAGFLLFNWPPAKIFLGDSGSVPLGFLAGALGLIGWSTRVWPIWFPVMVFLPFIADASATLARRLWRRERVWEAHRQHYYQRMIQMGGSHAPTVRVWWALMLFGAVIASVVLDASRRPGPSLFWLLCAVWIMFLVALGVWVDRRWAAFSRSDTQL